jgi:sporulation protein YlmC with PRC-barrel domain
MENDMKCTTILMLAGLAVTGLGIAQAQQVPVAGSSVIGVAAAELRVVATGWSVKRQVLGQAVFNDNNEKVGTIDDVVIGPDKSASFAIIGAGGFLGMGKHDVAIPVGQLKQVDGKFVLAGATKEALKAMPPFDYAR